MQTELAELKRQLDEAQERLRHADMARYDEVAAQAPRSHLSPQSRTPPCLPPRTHRPALHAQMFLEALFDQRPKNMHKCSWKPASTSVPRTRLARRPKRCPTRDGDTRPTGESCPSPSRHPTLQFMF